jgi:hypothetical protein
MRRGFGGDSSSVSGRTGTEAIPGAGPGNPGGVLRKTGGTNSGGIPGASRHGSIIGGSTETRAATQRRVRADFNSFLVAVLLAPNGSSPFSYHYEREMEAKVGKVDALSVKGPDGFAVWLHVDQKTHRPWMLNYRAPVPDNARNQQTDEDETGEPKMADYQIIFADHRQVANVWLPHLIIKTADGRKTEEWKLSKYKINPEIKPVKFEKKN